MTNIIHDYVHYPWGQTFVDNKNINKVQHIPLSPPIFHLTDFIHNSTKLFCVHHHALPNHGFQMGTC